MKSTFNFESKLLDTISLAELLPGSEAVVVDVEHTGSVGRRLLDLGLLPRTPVTVLRRAPLGDPVVYELRGYRLCLRRCDAARVRVRPSSGPAVATATVAVGMSREVGTEEGAV
jgi:ferrous iron transport protein A